MFKSYTDLASDAYLQNAPDISGEILGVNAQGDPTLRRPLLRQMQDESERDRPQDTFDCGGGPSS